MSGIYLVQGKVINIYLLLPICIVLASSNKFLQKLGQPQEICDEVFAYTIALIPGVIFGAFADLQLTFLIQSGHYQFQQRIQLAGAFINCILNYVLICWWNLGVTGAGAAASLTAFFQYLIVEGYMNSVEEFEEI